MKRTLILLLVVGLMTACAGPAHRLPYAQDYVQDDETAQACLGTYAALDSYVATHGIRDGRAARVDGYPFLRVNRFLSSFRNELQDTDQTTQWLELMSVLDLQARVSEINNLPEGDLDALMQGVKTGDSLIQYLTSCASMLTMFTAGDPGVIKDIRRKAIVADDYSIMKRTLGVYPIASIFFMNGVNNLHEETQERFAVPLVKRFQNGKFIRYAAADKVMTINDAERRKLFEEAAANPLAIPEFEPEKLKKLFLLYAPVWEINTYDENDFPGNPTWDEGKIKIDIRKHITFIYHSYTRFYDKNLLQLNYVIWFPARPLTGSFDLLGGNIDGITWRVTFDYEGNVLFYDTIHNCGCYHMVFPSKRIRKQINQEGFIEPILVPDIAPEQDGVGKLYITLENGTHYLLQIRNEKINKIDRIYNLRDYGELENLTVTDQKQKGRSMFMESGLVSGTERKERWFFWPMGITEPGAMRQRGRHAIAFVGRRHFDDPYLFEENFQYQ